MVFIVFMNRANCLLPDPLKRRGLSLVEMLLALATLAVASADYVILTNLNQPLPLEINGVRYRMLLEFSATDSFGFSTKNQFHVFEGATGRGALLGTFLPR